MIIEEVSATLTPGRESDAIDLWKRWAQLCKRLAPGCNPKVLRRRTGSINKISIMLEFQSLAEAEEHEKRRNADGEWQALGREHMEKAYTVIGTVEQHYFDVFE